MSRVWALGKRGSSVRKRTRLQSFVNTQMAPQTKKKGRNQENISIKASSLKRLAATSSQGN